MECCIQPVSYTHLDVYKRQGNGKADRWSGAELQRCRDSGCRDRIAGGKAAFERKVWCGSWLNGYGVYLQRIWSTVILPEHRIATGIISFTAAGDSCQSGMDL